MKVLHIIPDVNAGGASKGAYRIHRSVQDQGVDSHLLVLKKNINEANVENINAGPIGWLGRKFYKSRNRSILKKFSHFSSGNPALHSFGFTSRNILAQINSSNADIIHLHWIINMLTIEEIGQISKPVAWTFHDMWPICGGEHYVLDDSPSERFCAGYLPTNQPEHEKGPDYNRFAWERKLHAWQHKSFYIATCSHWLARCAKASPLFTQSHIEAINYPLDLNVFKPYPKNQARIKFNLPLNQKIILAGAVGGVNNLYKGGDLFRQAMDILAKQNRQDIVIALFGEKPNAQFVDWPFPVINLGHIDNESALSEIYSSADVFVMPSRQEAFGQVGSEAQACGTPLVAFDHGGPIDIVEHKRTGWLATPFDPEDLARGIAFLISIEEMNENISTASRERAVRMFSNTVAGEKYVSLYNNCLNMKKNRE